MNTSDSELLDDLADLPGWDTLTTAPRPAPSSEALTRSTAAVREVIAADALRSMSGDLIRTGVPPRATARRRRTHWAVAAIASAAAAAALVVAPTISTPGSHPVSPASATEFLTHLAATATAAPGVDDDYWKVRVTSMSPLTTPGSGQETTTTLWFGRSGGRWIATDDKVVKASDTTAPFVIGLRAALTWSQVTALPIDPVQLERDLRSMLGRTPLATGVARLLTIAPLSAAQRSALFTILSRQPGVTIQERVTDAAGRTGTALGFPFGPTETPTELVTLLLADDGTVLEVLETAGRDEQVPGTGGTQTIKKGDLLSRTTYLKVGGTNTSPVG